MADGGSTENQPAEPSPTEAIPGEGFRKRIGRYDHYYDARSFSYILRKTGKPKKKHSRTTKYALIVRREINERGRYAGSTIIIQSAVLCHILKDINVDVQGLRLNRANAEMSEIALFHSYDGLRERLQEEQVRESENTDVISDLMAAVHLVEEDQGERLRELANILQIREAAWESLLLLFKPNVLVFTVHGGVKQDRLLLLRQATIDQNRDGSRYVALRCEVICDDGEDFGCANEMLKIDEYEGVRPITDLTAFPLEFHENSQSVFAFAVARGKVIASMTPHWLREYTGIGVRMGPRHPERFNATGRVIISPAAFLSHGPSDPEARYNFVLPVRSPVQKETLSELQYAICNPVLVGFSFVRKSWGCFAISRLQDVVWNDEAFRSLVINEKQKVLIHGLVQQHPQHSEGFDDIIKGKGRGLIGRLAGPPGCGKTLTAEAIAETARKPLYQVTAGELGVDQESVDARLFAVLDLAEMWDAVLLIDEADVFLQQRTPSDFHRNAIVSIFLRQLEYYQGILILTTNLAEQCDAAFESRIHFSLHYHELDIEARKAIWSMFFARASLDVKSESIARLAGHAINGRQIKNAFSTAQTISLSQGHDKLRIEDIDVVLDVIHDWESAKGGKPDGSNAVPEVHDLF